MNRIKKLFSSKNKNILSIYFTAGYPALKDTKTICETLEAAKVDLVEIGIPFSDPVADGETIQKSNQTALENGMNLMELFEQISEIRKTCNIPIILMGYLNPILQYGIENFTAKCAELSVDGTIIPDLPPELFLKNYKKLFFEKDLSNIFLVTPQTDDLRIKYIDSISDAFIYAVSSAAVTGGQIELKNRVKYLEHLKNLKLKNPVIVGFGVSNKEDFSEICKYANGAIIGSAFIRKISQKDSADLAETVKSFVGTLR